MGAKKGGGAQRMTSWDKIEEGRGVGSVGHAAKAGGP